MIDNKTTPKDNFGESLWERAIGRFIENKLIVFVITAMPIGAWIFIPPYPKRVPWG